MTHFPLKTIKRARELLICIYVDERIKINTEIMRKVICVWVLLVAEQLKLRMKEDYFWHFLLSRCFSSHNLDLIAYQIAFNFFHIQHEKCKYFQMAEWKLAECKKYLCVFVLCRAINFHSIVTFCAAAAAACR